MKEIFKIIRNGAIFGLSALIVLSVGGYFLIKARTSTNPNLGDDGTSLYVNTNETLTAAKRNALVDKSMYCPSGFTAITNQGSMLGCLQNTSSSGKNCVNAIQDCRTSYGGRLPTYSELYIGFKNSLVTAGTAGIREWIDSGGYYYNGSSYYSCGIISNTTPFSPSFRTYDSTVSYYRCFIPR